MVSYLAFSLSFFLEDVLMPTSLLDSYITSTAVDPHTFPPYSLPFTRFVSHPLLVLPESASWGIRSYARCIERRRSRLDCKSRFRSRD